MQSDDIKHGCRSFGFGRGFRRTLRHRLGSHSSLALAKGWTVGYQMAIAIRRREPPPPSLVMLKKKYIHERRKSEFNHRQTDTYHRWELFLLSSLRLLYLVEIYYLCKCTYVRFWWKIYIQYICRMVHVSNE